jgi:putative endonuclease
MREHHYYVYILASSRRVLYIGVTSDLLKRVVQHREKFTPGFTATYNVNRLVYYELYGHIRDAIAREKRLKRWTRARKNSLVESMNPTWKDLFSTLS